MNAPAKSKTMDKKLLASAADFYDRSPDGQYDSLAAECIRMVLKRLINDPIRPIRVNADGSAYNPEVIKTAYFDNKEVIKDTPRTDAEETNSVFGYPMVSAEFARQLERELEELSSVLKKSLLMRGVVQYHCRKTGNPCPSADSCWEDCTESTHD